MSTPALALRLQATRQRRDRAQLVTRLADALLLRLRIDPRGRDLSYLLAITPGAANRTALRLWIERQICNSKVSLEMLYPDLERRLRCYLVDFESTPNC